MVATAAILAMAGCGAQDPASLDASPGVSPGASPPGSTEPPGTPGTSETPEPTVTDDDPTLRRSLSPAPDAGAQPPRSGEVPDRYLERVIADAAERSGAPRERIEVTRDEAVRWRDGSLGCPEPGMMYTQAIVDGFWVELRAEGRGYDYRLDGQGHFRLCEQPQRGSPYPGDR